MEKNVQVFEMEEREEQDQSCIQVAISCNSGIVMFLGAKFS